MEFIPDDILIQFEKEAGTRFAWDDYAHKCAGCTGQFATGDVVVIFGDLDVAAARIVHFCATCGFDFMTERDRFPSGMAVHVERRFKGKLLSQLPPGYAERIRGSLITILDAERTLRNLYEQHKAKIEADEKGTGDDESQG